MINLAPIAAANKASLDTLFDLSTRAFEGVEQLVALNLQTIKTVLAESKETSLSALQAKSPADLLKLQTEALQAAPQKALSYGHQVQAIFEPIAAAQRATFDAKIADVQAKFLDAIKGAVKDGPAADTAEWAPQAPTDGVVATPEVLTGIAVHAEPHTPGGRWIVIRKPARSKSSTVDFCRLPEGRPKRRVSGGSWAVIGLRILDFGSRI